MHRPRTLSAQSGSGSRQIRTLPASKAPKMRFKPGQRVLFEGTLYEIVYAYRIASNQHEWIYSLEEINLQPSDALGVIDAYLDAMGAGKDTPRIVYEIFYNDGDATSFFMDIPCRGDRVHVSNKRLLQAKAEIVGDASGHRVT